MENRQDHVGVTYAEIVCVELKFPLEKDEDERKMNSEGLLSENAMA